MFEKKYKAANQEIQVDQKLKEETIKKMELMEKKIQREKTDDQKKGGFLVFNKGSFKKVAIAASLLIIITSLLVTNTGVESYALASPLYPPKTSFAEQRPDEKIDAAFLDRLNEFSLQSSSKILSETDDETNRLFSPISLYMALAMVTETAEGETQAEILKALQFNSMDLIQNETGKLFRQLYFNNEIGQLKLANSLWLNETVDFKERTLKTLAEDYYAHSLKLDFNDRNSSKEISKWVAEQTGNKLGTDSSEFVLDPASVMTLINTVDFYDEWVDSFDKDQTKTDVFYPRQGNPIESDFMSINYGSHLFAKGSDYTVSSLGMKNNNQMLFILPDEDVSAQEIISDQKRLKEAVTALSSDQANYGEVLFKVPKFDFTSKLDLKELAKTMGIETAFSPQLADFTSLSDFKPLFISGIKQSARISIDEKGVAASAFTQIDIDGSVKPEGRADMVMNRPFIFVILGADQVPLFVGLINNPNL